VNQLEVSLPQHGTDGRLLYKAQIDPAAPVTRNWPETAFAEIGSAPVITAPKGTQGLGAHRAVLAGRPVSGWRAHSATNSAPRQLDHEVRHERQLHVNKTLVGRNPQSPRGPR
jgi:hypothetical protein